MRQIGETAECDDDDVKDDDDDDDAYSANDVDDEEENEDVELGSTVDDKDVTALFVPHYKLPYDAFTVQARVSS